MPIKRVHPIDLLHLIEFTLALPLDKLNGQVAIKILKTISAVLLVELSYSDDEAEEGIGEMMMDHPEGEGEERCGQW